MNNYRVTYYDHDDPDKIRFLFLCQAEDMRHAIEQCRDAYPDCVICDAATAPLEISA